MQYDFNPDMRNYWYHPIHGFNEQIEEKKLKKSEFVLLCRLFVEISARHPE